MHIQDPEAEGLSQMMQQETLCDGQQTGRVCAHYVRFVQKIESANPEFLKLGQVGRFCNVSPGFPIEMYEQEKRTWCLNYKPRKLPLLQRLGRALKVINTPDPFVFDPHLEDYNPLTKEEMDRIFKRRSVPVDQLMPPSASEQRTTAGFGENLEDLKDEVKEQFKDMTPAELAAQMGWDEPEEGWENDAVKALSDFFTAYDDWSDKELVVHKDGTETDVLKAPCSYASLVAAGPGTYKLDVRYAVEGNTKTLSSHVVVVEEDASEEGEKEDEID